MTGSPSQTIFSATLNPKTQTTSMSHFTTIKTAMRDITALRAALAEMSLSLFPNATARGYYENHKHGDYVIRLKGPYDIALNQQPDGTFGLTADLYANHVEQEVGQNYSKLLQLYGVQKAIQGARKKGRSVMRKAQADGAIKLTVMGQ